MSTLLSCMHSDYEQDWRNRKSNHVRLMVLKFSRFLRFTTVVSLQLDPSVSLHSTLYVSWENRFTRRVPTSAGFYFLPTCGLWHTDSWCSAHGFLSISGSFPFCLLILHWSGLIWVFYWALVSSEREWELGHRRVSSVWLGRASKRGLRRFANYLAKKDPL